jgi:3',5'-cyclic AMP phosphodiesterase CpdA
VAIFHHPFYSTSARRDNKAVRENLKPLFDKYGVDLVLTGHDHTYARGMITPEGEGSKGTMTGPVYVISVSGSKQYRQDAERWWQVGLTNTQLWQSVSIDENILEHKAYDASGNIADHFVITRMKDGRKKFIVPSSLKTK